MSFFDDPPEPPDRPRQPKYVAPVWAAPPQDELPAVVPIGEFLHRSPRMVMAVKSIEVFSTGCRIDLVWTVRRGSESDREWARIAEQSFSRGRNRLDAENGVPGALRFGVAFADGRTAMTGRRVPAIADGSEPLTGPVLTLSGGGGGSGSDEEVVTSITLWLWPLPLDGDARLVTQWEGLGVPESSVTLHARDLAEAAGRVQKFWVDPNS